LGKRNKPLTEVLTEYLASLVVSIDGRSGIIRTDILNLLIPDYEFLAIECYKLNFGKDFEFNHICFSCGKISKHSIDLEQLVMIPPPSDAVGTDPQFNLVLKRSGKRAKIGYLDGNKEIILGEQTRISGNIDANQSDFLSLRYLEGCDPITYEDVIGLPLMDHKIIRAKKKSVICGYETVVVTTCEFCEAKDLMNILMSRDFLFVDG